MSEPEADGEVPFVESILHPSDFEEGSESAFAHALAIALVRQTKFTVFHSDSDDVAVDGWDKYPAIRGTLERWGMLPENSPRSAVFEKFGIEAQKIGIKTRRTTAAIADFLQESPTDLIVMASRGAEGLPRWIEPSVSERVARRTQTKTLFVPRDARGFVSADTGELALRRIVVAVDHEPNPSAAVGYATRAAKTFGDHPVEICLVHVGAGGAFPSANVGPDPAFTIEEVTREGDVVDAILGTARERDADLIVMTTQGHQGFLDALRGSTTERVLRGAPCPLLAVPADA